MTTPTEPPDAPSMGDVTHRLGDRYELGDVIGTGGMAEVHLGRDVRLGRNVAIKLLRADLARDPSFQARFRREAQSAASLNHPNIVAVYDTGEDDVNGISLPFIVMEYVQGATLRDLMKSGRKLAPERALEITDGVLAALEYSHRMGIVHRDIKPGNVMLSKAGQVKVMDFGIARAMSDSAATMTAAGGGVLGTAQYLSPEQARGEQVDARSDLYSAGCVLYELLTGRPPFMGDSPVSVAYQHVREEAEPPSTIDPSVPAACDAIVLRALAKSPDDRYPSAAAMRADVDRARTGRTVAAPAVATTTQIPTVPPATAAVPAGAAPADKSRRNRALIGVLIALVVALALLAIVFARDLFGSGTQVRVPAVVGLTVEQAAGELESSGLNLGRQDEEASDRPVGEVLDQDPDEGELVDEGGSVNVTVSSGPGEVQVPTLVGLTQEQAVDQLNQAGLELGTITPQESAEPDREVLASDPAEGSNVDRGTRVNLTVSSGRIAVPDVTNQPVAAASSTLEQLGFEVQLTEEPSAAATGTVIRQSPAAGTVLPQGRTVTLVVASALPEPTPTQSPTETATAPPPPAPAAAAPTLTLTPSPSPSATPTATP